MDVGCGDGRVCIALNKVTNCKCLGVDISPLCVEQARENAEREGCGEGDVGFSQADVCGCVGVEGGGEVDVVYMFVYPTLLSKVGGFLGRMRRLERIVTNTYHFGEDGVGLLEGWREEVHECTERGQPSESGFSKLKVWVREVERTVN